MNPSPSPAISSGASDRAGEELVAIVFSHNDVSRDILESVALDAAAREALHAGARMAGTLIHGLLAFSTCLRTELYAVTSEANAGLQLLASLLSAHSGASPAAIGCGRWLTGADAARHLFRVSAGLDSILLGEDEILGQLRDALRNVSPATAGPVIHRLFEAASTAGARVRHETALGAGRPALGRAAASTAGAPQSGDDDRMALVVGAGAMGRQAARQLRVLGWRKIAIANRSAHKAEALACEVGGSAHSLDELDVLISKAAVIITALTDTPAIIDAPRVRSAGSFGALPRAIIDLGSPRNVALDVRSVAGVTLTDLDGFTQAAQERRESHALAIPAAEAIVEDEVRRFMGWANHRRLVPLVRRLRETMQSAADVELELLLEGRPDAERETMRRVSQAMVNRLLHHPLTRLRHIAGERPDQIGALTQLEALFAPPDVTDAQHVPLFPQHVDA